MYLTKPCGETKHHIIVQDLQSGWYRVYPKGKRKPVGRFSLQIKALEYATTRDKNIENGIIR